MISIRFPIFFLWILIYDLCVASWTDYWKWPLCSIHFWTGSLFADGNCRSFLPKSSRFFVLSYVVITKKMPLCIFADSIRRRPRVGDNWSGLFLYYYFLSISSFRDRSPFGLLYESTFLRKRSSFCDSSEVLDFQFVIENGFCEVVSIGALSRARIERKIVLCVHVCAPFALFYYPNINIIISHLLFVIH